MSAEKIRIMHNGRDILIERKKAVEKISTFLIFDIETVPDTEMVELAGNDKDREKLEGMRAEQDGESVAENTFLQPHFHQIVAVSTLIIRPNENGDARLFELDLVSVYGAEAALVKHFWQRFRDAMLVGKKSDGAVVIDAFPCLVSFNGRGFDMPVILARTLKHASTLGGADIQRIALYHDDFDKWENQTTNYRHAYSKYHVDLCREVTGKPMSLAAACHLAGITAKTGMDGKDVWKAYQDGKQREIAAYCAEDVLATAQLFSLWNEAFLGGRFVFPTRAELAALSPKIGNMKLREDCLPGA